MTQIEIVSNKIGIDLCMNCIFPVNYSLTHTYRTTVLFLYRKIFLYVSSGANAEFYKMDILLNIFKIYSRTQNIQFYYTLHIYESF